MNLASHAPSVVRRSRKMSFPIALAWSHCGVSHRVSPWPEVRFERLYGDDWIEAAPTADVLASAAQACGAAAWEPYLEFVPADVREFLRRFSFARMEALQVVARCP